MVEGAFFYPLLTCQLRFWSSIFSALLFLDWHVFNLIQEVYVRLVSNASPLHRLPQILRLDKLPSPLQIIPLKEDNELIGVIGTAEEMPPFRTAGPACGPVLIEYRLPLGVIFDFMADKYVRYNISPPFL